jgi:hypothetical protein
MDRNDSGRSTTENGMMETTTMKATMETWQKWGTGNLSPIMHPGTRQCPGPLQPRLAGWTGGATGMREVAGMASTEYMTTLARLA